MAKTVISLPPEVIDLVISNLHDLHDLRALALSCHEISRYCLGISSSNLLKIYVNTYPDPYGLLLASVKAQQMGQWDIKDLDLIQSVLSADEAEVNESTTDKQSATGEGADEEGADVQSIDEPNTTKLWHALLKLLPLKFADLVAVRIFYLDIMGWAPGATCLVSSRAPSVNEDNFKDKNERFNIALNTALYAFESFCQLFRRDLSPYNIVLQNTNRTTAEIGTFDNLRWRFLQRIFPQCIGRSGASSMAYSLLLGIMKAFPTSRIVIALNYPFSATSSARRRKVTAYAVYKGLRWLKDWEEDPCSSELTKFCDEVCCFNVFFFSHWLARVQELKHRLRKGSRC